MPTATRKSYDTPRNHDPPAPAQVTRGSQDDTDTDAQAAAAAAAGAAAEGSSDAISTALMFSPPPDPDGTNENQNKRKQNHDPNEENTQENSHDQARKRAKHQSQPESGSQQEEEEEADEDDEEKDDTQNQKKRPAVGTVSWQAQDQARKRAKEQSQPQSQQEDEEEEEAKEADQEMEDTLQLQQQDEDTEARDNSEECLEAEDAYEEESDSTYREYIQKYYSHLDPAKLKELMQKLSIKAWEYWENQFNKIREKYDLRWNINFPDYLSFLSGDNNAEDSVEYRNTTENAIFYDEWQNCCNLIENEDEKAVLNKKRGIYMAIICGADPTITYNVEKLTNELKAAFPNNGKSDEEMKSLAEDMISKSLDCTDLIHHNDSRFIVKVGYILTEKLYKRLRNLIAFNSRPDAIKFKFLATEDLCRDQVKKLETLIKLSLFLESRYSGNGEVYYANTQIINNLFRKAKYFTETGKFNYNVEGEETPITAGKYKEHPKYQEYLIATNLHARRASEKRKQSAGQDPSLERHEDEEEEDPSSVAAEDTSNIIV
jgi:hypothetical protein